MIRALLGGLLPLAVLAGCVSTSPQASLDDTQACTAMVAGGLRKVADERGECFNGKVGEDVARCRGADKAVAFRKTPYVDWANYWATGDGSTQLCQGELIRWRQLDGICNDIRNPRMGSAGTLFARNVQFEATYPDSSDDPLARNRHGDRLSLLQPDPQLISRKLLTRAQTEPAKCRDGQGLPGNSTDANCDYQKAPFFNVLAAFWI